MESTGKIIRRSIFTFLKHYQFFAITPALLLLPFSASVLLFQAPSHPSSPLFQSFLHVRGASFFFHRVSLVFLLVPFGISSCVIAKAAIIHQFMKTQKPFSSTEISCSSFSLFKPLLVTCLCSLLLIITMDTASFYLFLIPSNHLKATASSLYTSSHLFLRAAGAATNAVILSNLALVAAAMDAYSGGYAAIYKAYRLLRNGRNISMALLLALPTSLGFASLQALFSFRVIMVYLSFTGKFGVAVALEGLLIAYLHALLVVLDTIICCFFYHSCDESQIFVTNQEKKIPEELP